MTPRPFQFSSGLAALALGTLGTLATMAPAAMAHPHSPNALMSCQRMVQVGSNTSSFPRVAVGCGTNVNGLRGYVSPSTLYQWLNSGGRGVVISESQEVSPNQWGPHTMTISGRQAYDAKGNNVIVIP